ncbi:MFS transporter [Pseudomonas sp. B21-056]|jgi:diaminobutyrate-2-oxoglutarate transaminase|uniref:MFS transporter n=1 Tax=Pseudomonas sp. B21-056 TaxID=2895495 RepID=UPI002231E5D2|nr:MFS transporter [Pseudomonas sp. B21-056]UZE26267.1 MFS transporter [Pseudomonas sp. B21-056]
MNLRSAHWRFDLGRSFYLLWCGESLTVVGTTMMGFALGVWIYSHTGSAMAFSNAILATTLPALVFLPLAGGLADRISHRVIIVCCDVILTLLLFGVIVLLWLDHLEPLHLYIFNCLASIVAAFRKPAYQAAVTTIVAPQKFTRASGLISISKNVSALVAPQLAGIIMAKAGLSMILVLNVVTFCSGTVLVVKAFSHALHTSQRQHVVGKGSVFRSVLRNIASALKFLSVDYLMVWLLVYTVARNALLSLATVMMTPLVLSTLSSQMLGMVYTWSALGGLFGAGLLILIGNPRRLMALVGVADLSLAICVISLGGVLHPVAYCVLAFFAITSACVAEACVSSLWMHKIPSGNRASVFALINMLTIAATSLVIFVGGLLVDHWFQPALVSGGLYADSIGLWLGVGAGRGVGMLFVVAGALFALLPLGILLYRPMRRLAEAQPQAETVQASDSPSVNAL